jgi:hypothetical protein
MTSSRDMKRQSITELVGGAGSLVRQGVKLGGKKGGRAVQQGQSAAIKAGQGAKVKASQGNQSKMVGDGKNEKRGAAIGGTLGAIGGALIPDGPAMVAGEIGGGIVGSKIGGKIGRQFDKRANTKTEQYSDWRSDVDIQELKFGEKGKTFFYNDPKARRDTLNQTGKDPGYVSGDAVKSYVGNKVGDVVKSAGKSVVDYAVKNPGKATAIGAGVVGAGLLAKKVLGGDKKKENNEQYTFEDFMEAKALDPALAGAASIRQTGAGGRKYPERKKSEGERTRVKAIGGGKTAPVASYKDRKDIGDTKARSNVEQQPTRERGTAGLSAKEQQRKAYRERKARESGGSTAPKKKEAEKKATELLKKKTTKAVAPGYKPAQASGMTRAERDKRRGEGERMLKGIMKDQETDKYKKETGTNPDAKGRTKILGRVNKRMST